MKHRWEPDSRFPEDLDLEVLHESGEWHMIGFIRWYERDKHYKCNFLDMNDDEFPDGQTFKTKRGAMNFCVRQLPAMWIRHNTKEADE
jgi:hypothetical protein